MLGERTPVKGHLFIAPGDITQLSAHAIAYSASNALGRDGNLYSAFAANVPGFVEWYDRQRPRAGRLHEIGDAFWMPLDNGSLPRGVVAVVSTSGPQTIEDKAAIAVRAALTSAVRELRIRGDTEHLLIALPTFRMGKGGDRRQRLRSARAQIGAARAFLAEHDGVDVAFIAYTVPLYQIFLEAHRETADSAALSARYPDLEDALLARECVFFVGAGLSSGAGLPGWTSLVRRLGDDLGLPWSDRHDYLDLAQWYRERFGRERLAAVLRELYATPARPTLAHYLLMSLPVRHVLTTNYDDLLERALDGLKRHPVKVLHQEDVARTGQNEVFVVKLHGDLAHPDEIILTRDGGVLRGAARRPRSRQADPALSRHPVRAPGRDRDGPPEKARGGRGLEHGLPVEGDRVAERSVAAGNLRPDLYTSYFTSTATLPARTRMQAGRTPMDCGT